MSAVLVRSTVGTLRPISTVVLKLLALLTLGAIAVGCGSNNDTTIVMADGEERELVTIEPAGDDIELVDYTSSVMGGVRFSVDPAHHLYTRGDTILVSISDPPGEAAWEAAQISLLTQTADGAAIESVGQVIDLIAAAPAEVTPNGTAIEVLGHHLAGYDVRADPSTRDYWVVAADRFGSPPLALFGFTPNARIFLGETPAGVLVAASAEADEVANINAIDVALGTLVATIELTGDGLDAPLPDGQTLEPDDVQDSTARGELDPDGPDALDAPFTPVAPGTYQLANFGPTFTLDFTEDLFVQPNFPGFIVLTDLASAGPGDRDIVLITGVVDLVPIAPGPVAAGEPVLVATAEQVLAVLGEDLEITAIEEVDLDGLVATRFDVRIPVDAACSQGDPCAYVFRTSWGFVKSLSPTQTHRIWWIDDGAEGPSMIIAMAPYNHDFIERVTQLLGTIAFNTALAPAAAAGDLEAWCLLQNGPPILPEDGEGQAWIEALRDVQKAMLAVVPAEIADEYQVSFDWQRTLDAHFEAHDWDLDATPSLPPPSEVPEAREALDRYVVRNC